MRVFLDTNVLASAFATRGLCEDVLREILAFHELIVSDTLVAELERVLAKKFKVPRSIIDDVITFLKMDAIEVSTEQTLEIPIRDKDDILIISSAVQGNADVFVTGDHELLQLRKINKMHIISPREFWNVIKKSRKK